MRIFVAVDLTSELRRVLASVQEELRRGGFRRIRWVAPSAIHLTLRFCGELSEETVHRLVQCLASETPCSPFLMTLGPLGVLPKRGPPRVLCVEVAAPERFGPLAGWVEKQVLAAGLPPEPRPFHPHLTLGRYSGRSGSGPGDSPTPRPLGIEGEMRVESFVLFRSHLGAGGARYEPLQEFSLLGSTRA